ncbi:uncharacterized protein LOC106461783 isoform X2 [Limulus polyphemus]|uniref:Uncharacterized protein LOC106461783 isoform X2 n=1 Tax=Limulus polyphemus TaxID=6850 RepID=A0ABM1SLP9_LIMPO|nr:uncharacterized protein LOC106461783 isoform X2 [Limulus polyphemus]
MKNIRVLKEKKRELWRKYSSRRRKTNFNDGLRREVMNKQTTLDAVNKDEIPEMRCKNTSEHTEDSGEEKISHNGGVIKQKQATCSGKNRRKIREKQTVYNFRNRERVKQTRYNVINKEKIEEKQGSNSARNRESQDRRGYNAENKETKNQSICKSEHSEIIERKITEVFQASSDRPVQNHRQTKTFGELSEPPQYLCEACQVSMTNLQNYWKHVNDLCPVKKNKELSKTEVADWRKKVEFNSALFHGCCPVFTKVPVETSVLLIKREISLQKKLKSEVQDRDDGESSSSFQSCNICHKIFFSYARFLQHRVYHKLANTVVENSVETL